VDAPRSESRAVVAALERGAVEADRGRKRKGEERAKILRRERSEKIIGRE
jgi:hypothetical protein